MNADPIIASSNCPPEERLYAVLAQEASADDSAHVAACAHCQASLRKLQSETTILQHHTFSANPAAPFPPAIGKYIIVGQWDTGPAWTTYRGLHAVVHRDVLVHVANQPLGEDRSARDAFLAASRRWMTRRPHVATVLDAGFHEQRPFLVCEYQGGMRLDRLSDEERSTELMAAFGSIAEALAALSDVPHAMLSPSSFVCEDDGQLTLIDWAAAAEFGRSMLPSTTLAASTVQSLAKVAEVTLRGLPLPPTAARAIDRALNPTVSPPIALGEFAAALSESKKGGLWQRWLGG